jgi:hypothetical protein
MTSYVGDVFRDLVISGLILAVLFLVLGIFGFLFGV